ncbi:heme/hemin ABC transporter substrate-binding protein [Propylenella binzhouense]|uniref:Hemin ABC transporter substrate-binding protein n=1 Tax=Propylenella binzhouense TaxID=2555902 RepID=A0A964T6P9_9HYPH|nr:ABC transporter substrate-binding protein [Propylenella binzhouense]MYZ49425.1 hemin ABC transporter substrate-binding protein [Propylenella binzhouense]
MSARVLLALMLACTWLASADRAAAAERIVSLGGSVTEILYALGLEDRIVAVDTTSLYPPEAMQEKPNVGYLRQISAEGVLSLDPTLIIAEADVGPPEAVAVIAGSGVRLERAPAARDAQSLRAKIAFVAEAAGAPEAGRALAESAAGQLESIATAVAQVEDPVPAIFVLSLQGGRVLAAGSGTSADAMLRLAGARNALSGFSGYKQVSAEALLSAAPEIIVMMNRGAEAQPTLDEIRAIPALAATPAAANGRLVAMDGLYLLGFGPRTAQAARDLAAAFYPNLPLPALRTALVTGGGVR